MVDLLIHPRKKNFSSIYSWINACVKAEDARCEFLQFINLAQPLNDEDQAKLLICGRYIEMIELMTPKCKEILQTLIPIPNAPIVTKPMVLVLDTETTGLSRSDIVIQLGYGIYDRTTQQLLQYYNRIWQTNKKSHFMALKIHGIQQQTTMNSPYDAATELRNLHSLMNKVKNEGGICVAHNANFDCRLLRQTAFLHGVDWKSNNNDVFCTLKTLKTIPVYLRGESTKNERLYTYFGGPKLNNIHDAWVDAQMTAFIYFHGCNQNWWI